MKIDNPVEPVTTTGEKLVSMAKDIEHIKTSVDDLKGLIKEVRNGYTTIQAFDALEQRVRNLEGTTTWITRLVIGTVITAVIGLVIITR